ncbi:MAG: DUF1080 domain-containing protein [Planctomycetia bacterium]|nr:DUF1080 domain-containing protein [Planctomycetia bacterium]
MIVRMPRLLAACSICWIAPMPPAAASDKPAYTDAARADADFPLQGEYAGEATVGGQPIAIGVQVVALGDGTFDVVAYPGGLPGAGWVPPDKVVGKGVRSETGGKTTVVLDGIDWTGQKRRGEIRDGAVVVLGDAGDVVATLPRVERSSPTLGELPPAGAVVIFDGPGPVDESKTLVDPRITADGLLEEGVATRDEFGDARWHVEFRLPYQPHDRGQARGNSGAYLQGCYEVQMLDSFGLEGKNNECGGIYSVAAPRVNMCLPPLAWQTYDIDFTAPRFEGGAKVRSARLTVRHNGILVHDDVEVPAVTRGGPRKEEGPTGPLYLQNHGNPVRYRTIWVVPKS